jgi:hypothetical protein
MEPVVGTGSGEPGELRATAPDSDAVALQVVDCCRASVETPRAVELKISCRRFIERCLIACHTPGADNIRVTRAWL